MWGEGELDVFFYRFVILNFGEWAIFRGIEVFVRGCVRYLYSGWTRGLFLLNCLVRVLWRG